MKKIDLHMHTVPTISDAHFNFSLEKLKEYVNSAELDAIAIMNHDVFGLAQFRQIDKGNQWGLTLTDPHKTQLTLHNGLAINCWIFK